MAGVDGNGQRELAEASPGSGGRRRGRWQSPVCRWRRGARSALLGFIPEDRHRTGLILDFDVAENLVLKTVGDRPYSRHQILDWGRISSTREG